MEEQNYRQGFEGFDPSKVFPKIEKPTEKEIEETIGLINERLSEKKMNKFINAGVKEGYLRSLEVLKSRVDNIENMKTVQGRAIASLAYDYLIGECTQKILVSVPVK